jgi:hypothetical protein
MLLSHRILFFLGISFLALPGVRADEASIFIDPSDPSLIRRTEIPFASEILLNAAELPEQSMSHPKILFGEQKFSYIEVSPQRLERPLRSQGQEAQRGEPKLRLRGPIAFLERRQPASGLRRRGGQRAEGPAHL